jgi:putative Mn2+ efflux pump MntP
MRMVAIATEGFLLVTQRNTVSRQITSRRGIERSMVVARFIGKAPTIAGAGILVAIGLFLIIVGAVRPIPDAVSSPKGRSSHT